MALEKKAKIVSGKPKVHKDQILGEGRSGRIITRWTSSIWKLLWKEYLVYVVIFMAVSLTYRYALNEEQQLRFEDFIRFVRSQYSGLPLTFLLGFYVSLVVSRWWSQYVALPWIDDVATFLSVIKFDEAEEEHGRILRRTIIRYCILSWILCIRRLSIKLRKAYPRMKDIVDTGLVTEAEAARIGLEDSVRQHGVSNWWMPLKWATELAEKDKTISSNGLFGWLILKITGFRASLTEVLNYGHVPIPLVYSQVVTLAVRLFFFFALIGKQWIIYRNYDDDFIKRFPERTDLKEVVYEKIDLYYPVFLTIEFMFYFGWLRVAETLYNPFGEDDDDFALEELINRHMKVGFKIVDKLEGPPALEKDEFWGLPVPKLILGLDSNPEKIELITNQEKRDAMI